MPHLALLLGLLAPVAFPRDLTRFAATPGGPAFAAAPGRWDARLRERGWVLFEGGQYKLWYTGTDGTPTGRRRLGLATSPDGLAWTRHPANPLLPDRWVEDVMVVRDGDRYLMVAEGEGDRAQLLTSPDGVHWHPEGTLDVRLTTGRPIPPGPFGTPTLLRDGGRWLLLYEREDKGVWLAASSDLKTWTNLRDDPVLKPGPAAFDRDQIAVNQVLKRGDTFYAYYHGCAKTGPDANHWSCGVAASRDLLHWTKFAGNPLTPPSANRSSGTLVSTPTGTRFVTTHPALYWHRPAPTVVTLAGSGERGFAGDGGPATEARLDNPFGVARGPDGCLYICDVGNHRVRRVSPDGTITTVAGNGTKGRAGDGGPATRAALDSPYELAWDRAGNLHFCDIGSHTIRRVDADTGTITTVAGTGTQGFSGDGGPATRATFNQPHSLAFGPDGSLYLCDTGNHRVRRIAPDGTVTTWAGDGRRRTAPDGSPIAGSSLHGPRAIAFAPDGTAWLALREGNAVLRLDAQSHTLKRVAGTGKKGFTGNGGPARAATLAGPKGIALGPDGRVYLADTESHAVRILDPKTGTIDALVGDGQRGDGPDGDPAACRLARPHGVWAGGSEVLVGDSENHRVRGVGR